MAKKPCHGCSRRAPCTGCRGHTPSPKNHKPPFPWHVVGRTTAATRSNHGEANVDNQRFRPGNRK